MAAYRSLAIVQEGGMAASKHGQRTATRRRRRRRRSSSSSSSSSRRRPDGVFRAAGPNDIWWLAREVDGK